MYATGRNTLKWTLPVITAGLVLLAATQASAQGIFFGYRDQGVSLGVSTGYPYQTGYYPARGYYPASGYYPAKRYHHRTRSKYRRHRATPYTRRY